MQREPNPSPAGSRRLQPSPRIAQRGRVATQLAGTRSRQVRTSGQASLPGNHRRARAFPTRAAWARALLAGGVLAAFAAGAGGAAVKVWEREEVIPTYLAGEAEPNPMFYFGRNSQGAEGRVYPYPLYDRLTNVKSNQVYRVVYLENEYVRLGILPAIGGRLFEAVDKSNGYNFVYRQHVIKPALIGLIGAWISGGIEWNIPHHHRATTFLPVQYRVEAGADGSRLFILE
jgi:hypothetical protein